MEQVKQTRRDHFDLSRQQQTTASAQIRQYPIVNPALGAISGSRTGDVTQRDTITTGSGVFGSMGASVYNYATKDIDWYQYMSQMRWDKFRQQLQTKKVLNKNVIIL